MKSEGDWVPKISRLCCSKSKLAVSSITSPSHRDISETGKISGTSYTFNWKGSITKQLESKYSKRM